MKIIEQIKSNIPISWVAEKYMQIKKTTSSATYIANCPFHVEKTSSFFIFDDKNNFHCFGCGAHGDVFDLVQKIENCSFEDALQILAELARIDLGNFTKKKESSDIVYFRILGEVAKWFMEQFKIHVEARDFAEMRGLTPFINLYKIGFAPKDLRPLYQTLESAFDKNMISKLGIYGYDRYLMNRLIFPVVNEKNQIVSFIGRTINHNPAKYINSQKNTIFEESKHLYGLNNAKQYILNERRIIFVEGVIDTISMQTRGNKTTVGLLGTSLKTEIFIKTINEYKILDIYFMLDNDTAGKNATLEIIKSILPHITYRHNVFVGTPEPCKDPDEFFRQKEKKNKILDQCIPLTQYIFLKIKEQLGITKIKYFDQISQFNRIKKSILQLMNDQKLVYFFDRRIKQLSYNEITNKLFHVEHCETKAPNIDEFCFSEIIITIILRINPSIILIPEIEPHKETLIKISEKKIIPKKEEIKIVSNMIVAHGYERTLLMAIHEIQTD